jgi:hypothetical protein
MNEAIALLKSQRSKSFPLRWVVERIDSYDEKSV